MNDSGANKIRVNEARKSLAEFYRSNDKKVTIDIDGLSHGDVEKILYGGLFSRIQKLVAYLISLVLLPLPFSGLRVLYYRRCGASIGKNVYLSPGAYIDTLQPSLVSIGNKVILGMGAKVIIHERTMRTLSIGRVAIGNNVTIGGMTIIRHATTIGDGTEIDMQCIISKDMPPNTRVVGTRNSITLHGKDL
jgi:acetyltransferase-like isoleucine patch superfamily enzyme